LRRDGLDVRRHCAGRRQIKAVMSKGQNGSCVFDDRTAGGWPARLIDSLAAECVCAPADAVSAVGRADVADGPCRGCGALPRSAQDQHRHLTEPQQAGGRAANQPLPQTRVSIGTHHQQGRRLTLHEFRQYLPGFAERNEAGRAGGRLGKPWPLRPGWRHGAETATREFLAEAERHEPAADVNLLRRRTLRVGTPAAGVEPGVHATQRDYGRGRSLGR